MQRDLILVALQFRFLHGGSYAVNLFCEHLLYSLSLSNKNTHANDKAFAELIEPD